MGSEKKDVENWGNNKIIELNKDIDKSSLKDNDKNKLWWESMPMSYNDWEKDSRVPENKDDFDRLNEIYFSSNPYIDQKLDFKKFADKKVLEVGCGMGSASVKFSLNSAKISSVDLTKQAVQSTTKNLELHDCKNFKVINDDAEKLEKLDSSYFDFIYSWGVMHHSSDPIKCYSQAYRVLKQDGEALIMIYNKNSLRYWIKGLFWLIFKGKIFKGYNLKKVQRFFTDGYYHNHYSKKEIREIFKSIGFKIKSIDVTHMNSTMVPFIPNFLRNYLKSKIGWLLVVNAVKK